MHASPARAADGDPVLLAQTNQAFNPTVIEIVDSGQPGLQVISRSDDGSIIGENASLDGYGVSARGGYIGLNATGEGVSASTSVSDQGVAIRALTYDSVAVEARTAVDAGLALDVVGAARFSRSGRATVEAGDKSVTVAASVRPGSSALATLQTRQAKIVIEAAVPDPQAGTLTIWLNRAAKGPIDVAWILIE